MRLGRRLDRADEGAHEFPVHLGSDRLDVDSLPRQKFAGVFGAVDAGWLQIDSARILRRSTCRDIHSPRARRRHSRPKEEHLANFGRDLPARHDVGDGETAAGLQNAKGFAQNLVFIGGQIDDAVRDDHVDGVVGQWDALDLAFQEFDIRDTRLALVFVGEREHFVSHVEAVGFARGADASRREQHIDAAAGTEVEHDFAGIQFASAVGLPQPSEASTASSGIWPIWLAS